MCFDFHVKVNSTKIAEQIGTEVNTSDIVRFVEKICDSFNANCVDEALLAMLYKRVKDNHETWFDTKFSVKKIVRKFNK